MNVGPLSGNWLLHKTIMDTSRLGQSTRNTFGELLEQVLLKTEVNQQSTNQLDLATLLFASLNLEPVHHVVTKDGATLDTHLKGVLQNTGHLFEAAGKKYGIDPALLAAVSIHETGNGSSNAARFKFNVAGMMGKNGLKSYSSVEESIFDMARNLKKNYLDQGRTTIAQIGAKYAPVGAVNDPNSLNNHWVKGVQHYFNTLTNGTVV
jgi:flagellum-specific peptidoglycan hydrolase FlgJ